MAKLLQTNGMLKESMIGMKIGSFFSKSILVRVTDATNKRINLINLT